MTCKSRGGRDHVLLGDPALDEPVGIRELERAHPAVGGEIGVEDDEVVAFGSEPHELLAVGVHDVLVRDRRAARTGARFGLALERPRRRCVVVLDRLELESAEVSGREPLARCDPTARRTLSRTTRRRELRRANGTSRPPRAGPQDAP